MGLLSFLKRDASAPAAKPVADTADAVQRLRVRARRRLIGAAVLVGIGVIGFPLLFETQPRPIAVDLPIEIPRKESVAPLPMPAAPKDLGNEASGKIGVITDSRGAEPSARASEAAAPASAPATTRPDVAVKSIENAPVKSVETPAEKTVVKAVAETHAPVLSGSKSASAPDVRRPESAVRYVVQVGAFAEAGAAHDTRLKVEKLGLKTYTQVITNADGKRTRVRIGPFATREAAEKVLARLRASGLPAAVLTL